MNKIYCWGFTGRQVCVISDNLDDAWGKASIALVQGGFDEDDYDKEDVNIVEVKDGIFCVYDIWEFNSG